MRIALAALVVSGRVAAADSCPTLTVSMLPSEDLQIVAWVEDRAGNYVDTVFITQATGVFGIGNRPGRFGLRSGPLWPYGKRLDVFPVWSHAHGIEFPQLVFQDPYVEATSFASAIQHASEDHHFCRPMMPSEPGWDTGTCASATFTDKGTFSANTTGYPPRSDLDVTNADTPEVADFAMLNPFDAISRATPPAGAVWSQAWPVPMFLYGNYVLRVEVSKEVDMNATYNPQTQPPPTGPWEEYGVPYRGQPSVVYEVPFTIGIGDSSARTAAYAGYGDPDGIDGDLRAPDATIETQTPGAGAGRLLLAPDAEPYRVRVDYTEGDDPDAPASVGPITAEPEAGKVDLFFVAPGDDAQLGTVAGYEVRYRIGGLDEGSFDIATVVDTSAIKPVAAGEQQRIVIGGLAPRTPYSVGIRAYDECMRRGPLVVVSFQTARADPEVAGCCDAGGAASAPFAGVLLIVLRRRRLRSRAA